MTRSTITSAFLDMVWLWSRDASGGSGCMVSPDSELPSRISILQPQVDECTASQWHFKTLLMSRQIHNNVRLVTLLLLRYCWCFVWKFSPNQIVSVINQNTMHTVQCCVQVSSQGGSNSCGDTKTRPNSCSVSRVAGSRPIVILTNYVFIQTKHDINDHTASNSLCEPSVINLTDIAVVKSRLVNTKLLNWPFNVH